MEYAHVCVQQACSKSEMRCSHRPLRGLQLFAVQPEVCKNLTIFMRFWDDNTIGMLKPNIEIERIATTKTDDGIVYTTDVSRFKFLFGRQGRF